MLTNLFASKSKGTDPNEIGLFVNRDFSIKRLFNREFGLVDLDLLETIGTGTFGRVRLVRTIKDRRYFAMKMMKKARIVRLQQLTHIENEVSILSRLKCPFVTELYAVFQDEHSLFLLLEYIPGGELFSHLRRQGRFEFIQYQFYIVELISAIRYLHSLDILYRDLKPENILISKEGHIRLTDFGFAKIVVDRTFTLCGTPEYLAPEVIQGEGYGLAIDWWMLGILFYEMVVGYPPFFGENPFVVYQKILTQPVEFPTSSALSAAIPSTSTTSSSSSSSSTIASKHTLSAIHGLLHKNRTKRLGCGSNGFESIFTHKFFEGIEWGAVSKQLITPPTLPTVTSEGDTSNYDYYEEETFEETSHLSVEERAMFASFDRLLERDVSEA